MAVTKHEVLGDAGLDALLQTIFDLIENHYINRSIYEADMRELVNRIDSIDAYTTYPISIEDNTGNLIITVDDDESSTLAVNSAGDLILTTEEETSVFEHYSFNIGNDGYLYMVVGG